MRKPRVAVKLYLLLSRTRLRIRIRATERRIRRFDQLSAEETGRFVVSRRRVLESREVEHVSSTATPQRTIFTSRPLHLTVLKNVLLDVHYGFAITDSGLLLEETALDRHVIDRHLVTGKLLRTMSTLEVDRPTACLECAPNHSNFFHFWFQSMTKLLWLREPELRGLGPMYLAHTRELLPWQTTLLRAALPENVELLPVDEATLVEAPLYIDLPAYSGTALDDAAKGELTRWSDALLSGDVRRRPRRFYISRRGGKVRRPLNEPDVVAALESRGIATVVLEELGMDEQIELFRGAELVVAQHGAGLTHLLQAPADLRLLEIFSGSPDGMPTQYRGISSVSGFAYSNLFLGSPHHNDDVALPVEEICDWVDRTVPGLPGSLRPH